MKEIMKVNADDFNKVIKDRLVEKYADDALLLYEEAKKLENALEKYKGWIKRLEDGDITVIKEYKKERKNLEETDDYELQ